MSPALRFPLLARRAAFVLLPGLLVLLVVVVVPVGRLATSPTRPVPTQSDLDAAYIRAWQSAATGNQVSLAVDLLQETVTLTQAGVPVRVRSGVVTMLPNAAEWTGSPPTAFTLTRLSGSLPHVPVQVVAAPRDSAEAAARPPTLPPVESPEMTARLVFAPSLEVVLVASTCGPACRVDSGVLATQEAMREASTTVRELLRGNLPSHRPQLILVLAEEDVRAVYRALTPGSSLFVRWPATPQSASR